MESLVWALGRACVHAGALAVVVWLITRLWRGSPHTVQRWCWWLVCAKALLVLAGLFWIELPLLPKTQTVVQIEPPPVAKEALAPKLSPEPPISVPDTAIRPSMGGQVASTLQLTLNGSWLLVIGWLWLLGVLGLTGLCLSRWMQVQRLCLQSEPIREEQWRQRIQRLSVEMELVDVPSVRLTHAMHAPLTVSGWRVWVLLPRALWEQLSDAEREMVLIHEFAHIRRGDGWWGIVPMLAQILFFFFPPIRYAARQWELGCELASDEAVLHTARCSPHAYGSLLLKVVECTRPMPTPVVFGVSHNFSYLRTRLLRMGQARSQSPMLVLAALAIVALAALPWRLTAQPEVVDRSEWAKRLKALRQADWGTAYEVGNALASLPADEGYALLREHWKQLPVHARQQMLKAFYFKRPYPLRPRMHPRIVQVLELGVYDPSPDVRSWAMSYLKDITLDDRLSPAQVRAWFKRYRTVPIQQVVRAHWEPFLRSLNNLPPQEQQKRLAQLSQRFYWLRERTTVRPLAIRYRLPDLLQRAIYARRTDAQSVALVLEWIQWIKELQLAQEQLERVLAPFLDTQEVCLPSVRAAVIELLANSQHRWAASHLLRLADHALQQPAEPELWKALAEAFGAIGDRRALPLLRQMAEQAPTPSLQATIREAIEELQGK
jgi:beta-lactamase regulating signal transducer with metallopeptidase domain